MNICRNPQRKLKPVQLTLFPLSKKLEILFLISPSYDIKVNHSGFKDLVYKQIGPFKSRRSKAHISLLRIETTEELIFRYITVFKTLLRNVKPFSIHLNGFRVFDHKSKKTIYSHLLNQEHIANIFRLLNCSEKPFIPHITIAKSLTNDQFKRVWPLFENRLYKKSFFCSYITILVRTVDSDESWNFYEDIPLTSNSNARVK